MKYRRIVMASGSVNALLAGEKTETRRVVTPRQLAGFRKLGDERLPYTTELLICQWNLFALAPDSQLSLEGRRFKPKLWAHSPYGQPGGRLWVRETWAPLQDVAACAETGDPVEVAYGAHWDKMGGTKQDEHDLGITWRSPYFMPRWASRLTLKVQAVRVEWLHDITEEGAKAEGVEQVGNPNEIVPSLPVRTYAVWWNQLNAKRGYPWADNPAVWVIQFERVVLSDVVHGLRGAEDKNGGST